MAIKAIFTKVYPPTWSGGKSTCKFCGSDRASNQGGFYYNESGKLKMRNKFFCFACLKGETVGDWEEKAFREKP